MKIDEEKANECLCLWSQHIFFKELFNIISLFYFFTLPVVRVHRIIPVYHLLIIQHNKRTTTNLTRPIRNTTTITTHSNPTLPIIKME